MCLLEYVSRFKVTHCGQAFTTLVVDTSVGFRSWSRSSAVSPHGKDRSHKPGGRLPLLSARAAVTSPAAEHHCHLG